MRRLGRFFWRRKLLSLVLLILLGFSLTPLIIVTRTYFIVHPDEVPEAAPGVPVLEEQTEAFTCGVHALGTVYRAHGLDPVRERLRWRLGADTKALFWASDTTGALHPDVYMVLNQDFFGIDSPDPADPATWDRLLAHLDRGLLALFLVKRRATGGLHWVTGTRRIGERIEIFDSLAPAPRREPASYFQRHLVTALLLTPSSPPGTQQLGSLEAHHLGAGDLLRARKRIRELD